MPMLQVIAPLVQPDGSRISGLCQGGKLIDHLYEDVRTLYDAFQRGATISNNGRCLGWKPDELEKYQWLTYNEVIESAKELGAGIIDLGMAPNNNSRVGVYSQNRPEYVISDLGLWSYSMVGVPLYDTLGAEACSHIINQSEISIVICDNNTKVKNLLSRHAETPGLKSIVLMEDENEEITKTAKELGVDLIKFKTLMKLFSTPSFSVDMDEPPNLLLQAPMFEHVLTRLNSLLSADKTNGKKNPVHLKPPKPEDISIICYTSGTTGVPKGAMLTHRGSIATSSSCACQLAAGGIALVPSDVMISYLPLAHSYERLLHGAIYSAGGQIGFFQGDVRKLMDDIKELQPTLFPCVPRLLNRFYDKVITGVNASLIKRTLFNIGMKSKIKDLKNHTIRNDTIWDRIVFKKVQQALGGKVRFIATGSAPLSPIVLKFLRCIVGCPLIEGYGQTESHAICALQFIGDDSVGTVGSPLTCNAIKLVDIPEMGYFTKDNKGEICVKGYNVFNGYLKDKEKTDEALDKDGWLYTGDVGEWVQDGSLKIIDRKKHIFKLAQGEYIAPEKIENVCIQSALIAQIYVHGDSLKSCLVGIVSPDPDVLPKFAKDKLGLSGTFEELCQQPLVKKAILEDLTEIGKRSNLTSMEILKDIHVISEMFSVDNGLLTPTFKSKRNEIAKFYMPQILNMYSTLD